jgi:hypothetical protein
VPGENGGYVSGLGRMVGERLAIARAQRTQQVAARMYLRKYDFFSFFFP